MKTKKKVFTRLTVLLFLLFMAAAAMAPTASADPGWDSYREIEIDHSKVNGSADLPSFPVLINHTADWLKDNAHGGGVKESHGYDIVFTDSVNANKLDFEIEEYNGTAGILVAWVRIPALDHDANTTIRLYYGNSAATDWSNAAGVWDTNYKSVWHLKETTGGAGAIKDSTSNDNDGTDYGSPNLDVAGQIDGADAFDGTDDYLSAGTTNFEMQQGTYSAWVNFDNWANSQNDVLFSIPSEAAATSANLVGYWRRLDVGGSTVEDISGNENDGTIYGTGGTAESGTANTLTDTDQSWTVNEWAGETIYITKNTGKNQNRIVASNNDTTITVTSAWNTIPDHTSKYAVTSDNEWGSGNGRFGDAITFNGADNFMLVPSSQSLCPTAEITLEAWAYPTEYNESPQKIVQKGDWDGHDFCMDPHKGWKGGVYVYNVSAAKNYTKYTVDWGDGDPELNKWYHICLTYDGSVVRLFVNGVEEGNRTVPDGGGNLKVNSRDLSIGSDAGGQKFFNGTIDEVRFYDAAISEDRIRSLYLGALSAHKNADNNIVMHLGPATMTTDVSGLSGWHHVAGTYDNNDKAYLYLDGVEKVNTSFWGGTRRIFGDYSYFANDEKDQMQSAGKMDEFRVSASARSGDWINTSHNNQDSPSTFYSVAGTATSTEGTAPVPELPTVILFAVGLVVLVGYVMLRRRE